MGFIYNIILLLLFTIGSFLIRLVLSPGGYGFPGNIKKLIDWFYFTDGIHYTWKFDAIEVIILKYSLITISAIFLFIPLYYYGKNKKYYFLTFYIILTIFIIKSTIG